MASGEATVEKVFEEEALADNLNMGTESLIDFLCRPESLDKLSVYLSTELDVTEHDYRKCLKYPYLSAQLFTEYRVEKIMTAFLDIGGPQEGQRLARLYDCFKTGPDGGHLNPTLTGYFDGVFRALLAQHPEATLAVALRPELLNMLFSHFDDFSVLGVLLKTACLESQVVAEMKGDNRLNERLAIIDKVVEIFTTTPIDLSHSLLGGGDTLALGINGEKILNGAAYLRYLIKDMTSLDPHVVARVRDSAFLEKCLKPFFTESQFRSAESLSILVTLLDEVTMRKKKQSGMSYEQDPSVPSDDFIESRPFITLYQKVVARCAELLKQQLPPNLLYQVFCILTLISNYAENEFSHSMLTGDVLIRIIQSINHSTNENIAHSKAIELFEKVFGSKPIDSLAVASFGAVSQALGNYIKSTPSKTDLNTNNALSVNNLLARTLLVASRSSPRVQEESSKCPAWISLQPLTIERAKAYMNCLAGYKASDYRTDCRPSLAWGAYKPEFQMDWGSDSKKLEIDPFATGNVFNSMSDHNGQATNVHADPFGQPETNQQHSSTADPFKAFGL